MPSKSVVQIHHSQMNDYQFCRVCEEKIGHLAWRQHVRKHKIAFLKVMGRSSNDYRNVQWEDVVKYFNPKRAKITPPRRKPKPKLITLKHFMQIE